MATRRSPRSIERLCGRLSIPELSDEQTATLLALAHCTGWSADRISLKIKEVMKVAMTAEKIWFLHRYWVLDRNKTVSVDEREIMEMLLKEIGVKVTALMRPLSSTVQPKYVPFPEYWSSKSEDGRPLLPGFTAASREHSKAWLFVQEKKSALGKITPTEVPIVELFGSTVSLIMRDTLKRWGHAVKAKLRNDTELRPIKDAQYVQLIMNHLKIFQDGYESKFGLMEETKPSALGGVRDKMHIPSTGYGAKIFLGLIMADRVHVVDRKCRHEREKIGFVHVDALTLAEDSKNCLICQDELGVESEEGKKESPVKLVICCGQILGEECMKTWLKEIVYGDVFRENCPVCRYTFPTAFLLKIFGVEQEVKDVVMRDAEPTLQLSTPPALIDLISPSPSPERTLALRSSQRLARRINGIPASPRAARRRASRPIALMALMDEQNRELEESLRSGENDVDDFEMEG